MSRRGKRGREFDITWAAATPSGQAVASAANRAQRAGKDGERMRADDDDDDDNNNRRRLPIFFRVVVCSHHVVDYLAGTRKRRYSPGFGTDTGWWNSIQSLNYSCFYPHTPFRATRRLCLIYLARFQSHVLLQRWFSSFLLPNVSSSFRHAS
ncbi:unnamed protein product [Diplocarpon coronariae]